ncbi:hypothetical protein BV22DRAFT_1128769 [Leucogyrophana mollusca]|uniref:Uncharacterized protein n=1 Tax=Leucogyrophana mollusca TaxID=85980 RepID=A0ACB8BJ43_9AGAM|nr:hypothetical protein BV22DRAFT_1128769 [Leucogyrophana mollusca]
MSGTTAHGTVQTGTYLLINVKTDGYATLESGDGGAPLSQSFDDKSSDIKWNVDRLSNGSYSLLGVVYNKYASVNAAPKKGDVVKARPDAFQWAIRETPTKGEYIIFPNSDDSLYWGFDAPAEGGSDDGAEGSEQGGDEDEDGPDDGPKGDGQSLTLLADTNAGIKWQFIRASDSD